jgi:hypothetical protein
MSAGAGAVEFFFSPAKSLTEKSNELSIAIQLLRRSGQERRARARTQKTARPRRQRGRSAARKFSIRHFASPGAPDIVFEQEAADLASLEKQITKLTDNPDFQAWTKKMSGLLTQSPKREVYLVVD